jgi:hypothetical protein
VDQGPVQPSTAEGTRSVPISSVSGWPVHSRSPPCSTRTLPSGSDRLAHDSSRARDASTRSSCFNRSHIAQTQGQQRYSRALHRTSPAIPERGESRFWPSANHPRKPPTKPSACNPNRRRLCEPWVGGTTRKKQLDSKPTPLRNSRRPETRRPACERGYSLGVTVGRPTLALPQRRPQPKPNTHPKGATPKLSQRADVRRRVFKMRRE